jgi:C-methyltransferase-like protein/putative zinc binding protein/methyltransferase family protein
MNRRGRSHCRFCEQPLSHVVADLGVAPLCEDYLTKDRLEEMEPFYPVLAKACDACGLVQLDEVVSPERLFSNYAYLSSYSESWLKHARDYSEAVVKGFGLCPKRKVVELASNDGYLLQNFVARGIPALGVEPAENVARVASQKGIPTIVKFFGQATAREMIDQGWQADLLIANNVLAQVPDLNDFVAGIKLLLKPGAVATLEFPHLAALIHENQFDTIYHEHYSYFSLLAAERVFSKHDLKVFDLDELRTHGGSLRVYVCHADETTRTVSERVDQVRTRERAEGFDGLKAFTGFMEKVNECKRRILEFLIATKAKGESIAGYGAPAKGNMLLNFCGIRADFLDYTVDRNPYKQGKFLPGSHIPIYAPEKIAQAKPDYLFILPWNLKDEIMNLMSFIREWGAKFVVPIPELKVYS